MEALPKALAALSAVLLLASGGLVAAGPAGTGLMAFLAAALVACAATVAWEPRRGALVSAVWGMLANAYLFQHKLAASAEPSVCNVNSVINCDLVNSSEASELFGIPITLFGVGFYLGLAIAAWLAGPTPNSTAEPEKARFDQVNFLFAVFNLGYSGWLAYQSKLIGAVCVVCVSIYVVNLILLGSAWSALRKQKIGPLEEPSGLPMSTPLSHITATFVLTVIAGSALWNGRPKPTLVLGEPAPKVEPGSPTPAPAPPSPDAIATIYHLPRGEVAMSGTEPTLGSATPKYTLLEFADFGCPHCAHAFKELHTLVGENPDLQIRFRVFPLTGACNPALPNDNGPDRCFAALAALCAGRQDRYWEMSELLFANQPNFSAGDLTYMANQLKLDVNAWNTCMNDPTALTAIQADGMAGGVAQIHGTPTFFLKGTHGEQWIEIAGGVDAVEQILTAARSGATLPAPPPAPAER